MAGADGLDAGAGTGRAAGRMVVRNEANLHALTSALKRLKFARVEIYNTEYYTSICMIRGRLRRRSADIQK